MIRLIRSSMSELKNAKPEPVWMSMTNMGYGYVNNDWLLIFRSAYNVVIALSIFSLSYAGVNS